MRGTGLLQHNDRINPSSWNQRDKTNSEERWGASAVGGERQMKRKDNWCEWANTVLDGGRGAPRSHTNDTFHLIKIVICLFVPIHL